ncbi:MAG: hypothetical protein HWE23_11950 [Rhodobacteraceae bacterium]|nr:hypothetical protein [Paracoccaceae bacterium]
MCEYRLSAVAALSPPNREPKPVGSFQLTELTEVSIASVASRNTFTEECGQSFAQFIGVDIPAIGQFVRGAVHSAFWSAPGQWFVLSSHNTNEELAGDLKDAIGSGVSVSEQNDAWTCFELTGSGLNSVFERLAGFDVHSFSTGDVVRTTIEHMGCFVLCLETSNLFQLLVARSYARAMSHAVLQAFQSSAALEKV